MSKKKDRKQLEQLKSSLSIVTSILTIIIAIYALRQWKKEKLYDVEAEALAKVSRYSDCYREMFDFPPVYEVDLNSQQIKSDSIIIGKMYLAMDLDSLRKAIILERRFTAQVKIYAAEVEEGTLLLEQLRFSKSKNDTLILFYKAFSRSTLSYKQITKSFRRTLTDYQYFESSNMPYNELVDTLNKSIRESVKLVIEYAKEFHKVRSDFMDAEFYLSDNTTSDKGLFPNYKKMRREKPEIMLKQLRLTDSLLVK